MREDAYLPLTRLTDAACRLAEMGKDSRLSPSAAQREDAALLRRTAETVYEHGRNRLQHAFITPIEREDLLMLTQRMLCLVRCLERLQQPVCQAVPAKLRACLPTAAGHLSACCTALRQMTAAMPMLRRSDGFAKPLQTVRRQAEDAERLLSALSPTEACPMFYRLEAALEACRSAADGFALAVLKNS